MIEVLFWLRWYTWFFHWRTWFLVGVFLFSFEAIFGRVSSRQSGYMCGQGSIIVRPSSTRQDRSCHQVVPNVVRTASHYFSYTTKWFSYMTKLFLKNDKIISHAGTNYFSYMNKLFLIHIWPNYLSYMTTVFLIYIWQNHFS